MAIVPRYEQQVGIGNIPSVRQAAIAQNTGFEGLGFEGLAKAGKALAGVGDNVFKVAMQKQEEDNKAQFVKLTTDRKLFVQDTMASFQDWDSHKWGDVAPTFIKSIEEYDKNVMKSLPNNALKKSYSNLIQITAPTMNANLHATSEKMRLDANNADFTDSFMKMLNARDFNGAREVVEASSWSASDKEKMMLKVDGIEKKERYEDTAKTLFTDQFFEATKGDPKAVEAAIAKASGGDRDLADFLDDEWKGAFSDYNHSKNIRIEEQENKVFEGFDKNLSYGQMKKLIASMPDLDAKTRYTLNKTNERIHEVGEYAPKRSGGGGGVDAIKKAFITDGMYEAAYDCKNKEEFINKFYPLVQRNLVSATNFVQAIKRVGKLDPELWEGKKEDVTAIIESYYANSGNKDLKFDHKKMGDMLADIQKEAKRRGVDDVIGVAMAMYKPKQVKSKDGWFSDTYDSYSGTEINKALRELNKKSKDAYTYDKDEMVFLRGTKKGKKKDISKVTGEDYKKNIKPILDKYTPKKTVPTPKYFNKKDDDK